MRLIFRFPALVLPLYLCARGAGAQAAPASGSLTTEVIAAKAVPATVTIVTFGADGDTLGFGSGFLVRPTGVIVTNFHVMAGASRAVVILTNGERYERVQAIDTDSAGDLAILKIPGYGLPTLHTSPKLPPVGARLVAVGNPLGLSRTVTEGIVSAVRLINGRQVLQMSVAISPGSSGGPVLNARGEVVAIAASYAREGQSLSFAVPVRYAMGLVGTGRQPVELAETFGLSGLDDQPAPVSSPRRGDAAEKRGPSLDSKRPAPAAVPRTSVAGSYFVRQESWSTQSGQAAAAPDKGIGILLFGLRDNGFYSNDVSNDADGADVGVYPLNSLTTTPDGRVIADLGGTTFTGYQTPDGVYLEATVPPTPDKPGLETRLYATVTRMDLSSPNGLYNLSTRTAYTINGSHVAYFDWTGEAAIVTAHDSVYIDLWLENKKGGNTGMYAAGPLGEDGTFDLHSESRKHLAGRIGAGRLRAEWTDPREEGEFKGSLDGRHQ